VVCAPDDGCHPKHVEQFPDINKLCNAASCWIFIHSYSALRPVRQEPELSQATGMALAPCILGRFLGVGCHYFPSPLDVPTFVARCLHVQKDARNPSSGRCEKCCPVILPKCRLPRHLGIFYMPQICDMGPTALLPFRRKMC